MADSKQKLNLEPLVSILMLSYNRAHYIGAAIESVLKQSYQNWELIIIDDGSSDDTDVLVTNFNDPRIHYVKHEDNQGITIRRNESLKLATGKYIAILDSDDFWHSAKKLEIQVAFMENHPDCAVVGSNINIIDADSRVLRGYKYNVSDGDIRKIILLRNQFCHSSVLMRKDLINKTTGYFDGLAEDLEIFLQLGQLGTFANIAKSLVSHREHGKSANDHGLKMYRSVHRIIKMHSDYPHYFLALLKSYLRLLIAKLKSFIFVYR